jgi:hypothetical protein
MSGTSRQLQASDRWAEPPGVALLEIPLFVGSVLVFFVAYNISYHDTLPDAGSLVLG